MPSLPKIPARYAGIVLPFLLSVFMTCIISGVSTVLALELSREALLAWPVAWASSWIIGFPTLLVVLPFVRRLTAALVATSPQR
jgi:fucose 4-O-acetylase-like acetyltransferase